MPNMYTLVAPCFFGTEHTLSFEVKRLGAQNVKVTDGRVAFEGDAAMIAAANLNLRTAERVLLLLKTFPAALSGCSTATKPPLCRKPVLCTKSALPCVKTWWK